MVVSQIHNRYYSKNARGYYIIRKFYSKYRDQLENRSKLPLNQILHDFYLNLRKIDKSNIVNDDVNYILSAIHVQCRALLSDQKNAINPAVHKMKMNPESEGNSRTSSSEIIQMQEFLYQLSLFKLTLKDREIKILNSLIDGKSKEEITESEKLTADLYNKTIKKLSLKLKKFLKNLGIPAFYADFIFNEK